MEEILLIDGDSLMYYEAFKEQNLEEAKIGINRRLMHMCNENGTGKYIGFLTGKNCFRYGVADAMPYKHKRPEEKPELLFQLKDYMKDHLHFDVVDGLEADDLVMYWHLKLKESTTICSPDKDVLKQIAGRHYNYRWTKDSRGTFVETTEEEARHFIWLQTIMGDSTDGIPGLPGVGEVKATKILGRDPLDYPRKALEAYMNHFGEVLGAIRFAETLRLVYMLRTPEDVMRETRLELDVPMVKSVK